VTTLLDPYRLPTNVIPSAYRIRMEPDLATGDFSGTVEIDVDVRQATSTIVLNAVDLDLETSIFTLHEGDRHDGVVAIDAEHERAAISFRSSIDVGRHVLRLQFTGTLSDKLVGFYRSSYSDEDGTSHAIATTHFETTDARRAFPCFDEPSFKATFDITLVAPAGLNAYSNSLIVNEVALPDGRREVTFAPTMRMSTYLVAFVIGEFVQTPVLNAGGVPLAVVCRPSNVHLTEFALEVGAFSLSFFSDYFGIPYPGDKVDLVGIPDFMYGAMEQVGCVTFRETLLFAEEASTSQDDLVQIAIVIAHELAHMWFGDLVTMAWWEGLWLNEAFATYMSYLCVDAYRPSWGMWVRFADQRERGLDLDALHLTRPIEFPVRSPADAANMVDAITYQKGGSVLRMLDQYLGGDVFRDGIRRYLNEHAYANTLTADLWSSLEAVSGEPVGEVMDTWILQGGHPTVSLSEGELSQRPFVFGPPEADSAIGSSWLVPVLSRSLDGGGVERQLLGAESSRLLAARPAVVNAGGVGVYRTSYSADDLQVIGTRLPELSEIERAVLLGDTWALAMAGKRTISDLLSLVAGLGVEVEPATWTTAGNVFDFLGRAIGESDREALAIKVRELFGPAFEHFGWDPRPGEDERTPLVRASLVHTLGTVGADESVRREASRRFDRGVVEGDLADAIMRVVTSLDRPGDYDEVLRRFREAKDPLTEERYRTGLTTFGSEARCLQTLATCFETFRSQDAPVVITRLMVNQAGGLGVWSAVTERWDEMLERITPLMQWFLGLGLSFQVSDAAFHRRAVEFHRSHPVEKRQKSIEQALEVLGNRVRFAERERPGFTATLSSHS
jgi:puromycin-sensitive aminopeptidase